MTLIASVAAHEFESVTVTEYVPLVVIGMVGVVASVDQLYVSPVGKGEGLVSPIELPWLKQYETKC